MSGCLALRNCAQQSCARGWPATKNPRICKTKGEQERDINDACPLKGAQTPFFFAFSALSALSLSLSLLLFSLLVCFLVAAGDRPSPARSPLPSFFRRQLLTIVRATDAPCTDGIPPRKPQTERIPQLSLYRFTQQNYGIPGVHLMSPDHLGIENMWGPRIRMLRSTAQC